MSTNPNDPQFRLGDMLSEGTSPDMVGPFKPPDNGGINGAIGTLTNYTSGTVQRAEQAKLQAQAEMKTEVTPQYPGGWTTFSGPSELMNRFAAQIKKADSIDQNYERMVMEKQARIDQQKPWANALATIAGSLAANDPNPITRGLGQAAQQLNPTRAQLQAQQMQLLQGQAQAAGQGLQAAEGMQRLMETNRFHMANEAQRLRAESQGKVDKSLSEAGKLALKGGGPLSPDAFASLMKARGVTDRATIDDAYASHVDSARVALESLSGEQKRKIAIMNDKATIDEKRDQFKAGVQLQVARMHQVSADKALTIRQGEMNDRAAASREMRGYGKVEKDVMAAMQTIEGSQHLRQKIEDLKTIAGPDYVGIIEGRIPVDKLPFDDATKRRVGELRAEFFTMMNDVKNSFGAGARFWNPQEFQNLSPKLASAVKSNATNLGILDAIDASAIRTAKKLVQTNQDVDWESRQFAFGSLAPQIMEGQKMGGLQGKAGGTSQMKPQAAGTVVSPAGQKVWTKEDIDKLRQGQK